MVTPLKTYTVTQEFGETATDSKGHTGIDLAAPVGTPVYAVEDGVVIAAGTIKNAYGNEAYGNCILISHKNLNYSFYAHLDKVHVKAGQKVSIGQKIGSVGMTGNTSGPHLHFEIRTSPIWNRQNFRNPREFINFSCSNTNSPAPIEHDESLQKGVKAKITANLVNLRNKAGFSGSTILGELHLDTPVEIAGNGIKSDGLTWFPVVIKGYIAEADGYSQTKLLSKEQ